VTSTGDIHEKAGMGKKITLEAGEITLTATTKISLKVGANKIEISQAGSGDFWDENGCQEYQYAKSPGQCDRNSQGYHRQN
jgi:hypothetical protein